MPVCTLAELTHSNIKVLEIEIDHDPGVVSGWLNKIIDIVFKFIDDFHLQLNGRCLPLYISVGLALVDPVIVCEESERVKSTK